MRSSTGRLVPDFQIKVNGKDLPLDARHDLASIEINLSASTLSSFELEFYNWDHETQKVTWSDRRDFTVGQEIQLNLGYLDDLAPVMVGEVTSTEVVFSDEDPPLLRVHGYDRSHRMTLGHKTRTFASMSDIDIASKIAQEYGLKLASTGKPPRLEQVWQAGQTDLEFLRHRARQLGYQVYADDATLHFGPPNAGDAPFMVLDVQQDLSGFSARTNLLGQVNSVVVQGFDDAAMRAVEGNGREPFDRGGKGRTGGATARKLYRIAPQELVVDVPVTLKALADLMASGRYGATALSYLQGEGEGSGIATLRPDRVIEISGAGEAFSGRYYLSTVRHSLDPENGFRTSFTVQRSTG